MIILLSSCDLNSLNNVQRPVGRLRLYESEDGG